MLLQYDRLPILPIFLGARLALSHAAPLVMPPCNTVFPEMTKGRERALGGCGLYGSGYGFNVPARYARCYPRKRLPFTGQGNALLENMQEESL